MVLLYSETIHSLGGATDTGVAKVMIFMDVLVLVLLSVLLSENEEETLLLLLLLLLLLVLLLGSTTFVNGEASDQTGIEIGGGGGIDGEANAMMVLLKDDVDVDIVGRLLLWCPVTFLFHDECECECECTCTG